MKLTLAILLCLPALAQNDSTQFPKIASISMAKGLPNGDELSIVRVYGGDYFVVQRKGKDLPEIAERIDCSKAKPRKDEKTTEYHGKEKGWRASCDPEHPGVEPIMVFYAGGDPDFATEKKK